MRSCVKASSISSRVIVDVPRESMAVESIETAALAPVFKLPLRNLICTTTVSLSVFFGSSAIFTPPASTNCVRALMLS